jgi:hypothetical protein
VQLGRTPLHLAAACGSQETALLLINAGGRVNQRDEVGRASGAASHAACSASVVHHATCQSPRTPYFLDESRVVPACPPFGFDVLGVAEMLPKVSVNVLGGGQARTRTFVHCLQGSGRNCHVAYVTCPPCDTAKVPP